MSRSLLIIICDFLLLSMLALARFDKAEQKESKTEPAPVTKASQPEQEMVELLKSSLEEERQARELLNEQLSQTAATLRTREDELASREERLDEAKKSLKEREAEARQMELARLALEKKLQSKEENLTAIQDRHAQTEERMKQLQRQQDNARLELAELDKKYRTARSTAQELEENLRATATEARVSQQVLDALQSDLRNQVDVASQLSARVQTLAQTRQQTETEKLQLSNRLQVVQAEKQLTREQVENMRQEVQVVRQEKARLEQRTTELAANVSELADTSVKLTQEIRQARPLPPNAIFNQFQTNRVQIAFQGTRPGVFGQVRKEGSLETILISHNNQIFALFHISDTPLALEPFPSEWSSLIGTIGRDRILYSITQLSFLNQDPRILMVPIGAPQAAKLGCRIYPVADDPARFQEAVLIGATEGYYGECSFQLDPATPQYVRMNRERFTLFSGKFTPSRGDLVVSKSGEMLGIMANKEYCLLVSGVTASRSIQTGPAIEQPAPLLSQLYHQLMALPNRLQ